MELEALQLFQQDEPETKGPRDQDTTATQAEAEHKAGPGLGMVSRAGRGGGT